MTEPAATHKNGIIPAAAGKFIDYIKPHEGDPFVRYGDEEYIHELYTYPQKKYWRVFLVWLLTGLVGGHRYYLNQTGKGIIMTLTYGGVGILWLRDGFRLKKMVAAYNTDQQHRLLQGLPPVEMSHLPPVEKGALDELPKWSEAHKLTSFSLVKDCIVGFVIGCVLGKVSRETTTYEPAAALLLLLVILNFTQLLLKFDHLRLPRELLQWAYKLRLYYYHNAVPRARKLLFRPFSGMLAVIFKPKQANEASLYMELGFVFAAAATVWSVATGSFVTLAVKGEYLEIVRTWLLSTVVCFVVVFTCVSPIGATVLKRQLLQAPSWQIGIISLVSLVGLWSGLFN